MPSLNNNNDGDITSNTIGLVVGVEGDAIGEANGSSSRSNLGNVDGPMSDDNEKGEVCHVPLPIDDEMLSSLKRENATCTARSILKFLFPDPVANFKLSDVDKNMVENIVRE